MRARRAETRRGDETGKALDEVNAWGLLAEQQEAQHREITVFGPDVFRGFLPRHWAGVALWYKRRGYYYYDTLYLLGIWALRRDDGRHAAIELLVGLRPLRYALPFFSAESWHQRIQREFRTLYRDNGRPPVAGEIRYATIQEAARRLEIRRELEDMLRVWAKAPLQTGPVIRTQ